MKSCRQLFVIASVFIASAFHFPLIAQDEYVLLLEYKSSSGNTDNPNSSNSRGRQSLAEKVIAQTEAGTEVEYLLPGDPKRIKGNEKWMFPSRILVSPEGEKTVLDGEEIEQRVDDWLKEAKWPREVCGHWIFTWTAYHIRCDLPAIIEAVEGYGMRPGLIKEGKSIKIDAQAEPAILTKKAETKIRTILETEVRLDPEALRKKEAERAVAVAEMTGKELTLEEALTMLAGFKAQGTVRVELEVDAQGLVWRRTENVNIRVSGPDTEEEVRTIRNTVTRLTRENWDALYGARPDQ